MHLGQIKLTGGVVAAVFEEGTARPIPGHTMLDLLRRSEAEGVSLVKLAANLASRHPEEHKPVLPIHPPEVWGCGCTYEASARFRDGELGAGEGMYGYVYREPRPEMYFKGTSRVCVGPGGAIGVRPDSKFTAPLPELAVVLGSRGSIAGYTIANDVSAWDIERENPLYLTQSKTFTGCCALGPVILTADAVPDAYSLEISCTVTRGDKEIFAGAVSTSKLHRRIEALIEFLTRANNVPCGTVMLTGTGIIVPQDAALTAGDIVTIRIPEIGALTNPAATLAG